MPSLKLGIELNRLRFWHELLNGLSLDLKNQFSAGPKPFREISDNIWENIINSLALRLDPLLTPTIVSYIQFCKNKSPDDTKIYHNLFGKDFSQAQNILESFHSPTFYAIYNRCRRFRWHFTIACQRIFEDWNKIQNLFDINDHSEISKIEFTSGDEHNQGMQTAIFIFDNGSKGFAYKPVDMSIDVLMNNLFAYYEHNFQEGAKPFLNIYEKGDDKLGKYGYIEYCAYNGNAKNENEVKKTYYDLGKILAFGRFFKIADGHAENVIINAPRAIWLDLETAFHSFSSEMMGINPLEKTGLIIEAREDNTMFGIVSAIQGGMIPSLNLTRPTIYNDGQDDMYIRYFGLHEVKEKKNRIFLENRLCLPENYVTEIKEGYEQTFTNLLNNKEKILNFIRNIVATRELRTRHLFLATACYGRYIGLTNHIISFQKGNILTHIRSEREKTIKIDEKPFQNFIIENEVMDICNGVIPYFYRTSNSNNIYHISGAYRENFFQDSIFDIIEKHILSLSFDNIAADLNFIDKAIKSTSNIPSWEVFKTKFKFPIFDYEEEAKK